MLQMCISDVATESPIKKIIGQTDASAGIFGKIAKIILELLSLAQFHPSTIKKFNLMPELYKWVRIYPMLSWHAMVDFLISDEST